MKRRSFIQTTTLAGSATLLPYDRHAAGSNQIESENGKVFVHRSVQSILQN